MHPKSSQSSGTRDGACQDAVAVVSTHPVSLVVPRGTGVDGSRRRTFTAEYKERILLEAAECTRRGKLAALLRRESLYASHLSQWRRAWASGGTEALSRKRGPKSALGTAVLAADNERLRQENTELREHLRAALATIRAAPGSD